MKNVTVIEHPVVQHNLTILRDERTPTHEFRRVLAETAALMAYEATRAFGVSGRRVRTPCGLASGKVLRRDIILVPVLRAGLGMMTGVLQTLSTAKVGFIGLKREETTLEATSYHKSLPAKLAALEILLIDPMLATGGSAVAALDLLAARGASRIVLLNLVAAPEGITRVHEKYPKVPIFTAAVDKKLNPRGYIVPGLGDAGDRIFGV